MSQSEEQVSLIREIAKAEFKELDKNGDGEISPSEFAQFMHGRDIPLGFTQCDGIFDAIDNSGDRIITGDEFTDFLCKPRDTEFNEAMKIMARTPTTYACIGYLCGSIANFSPNPKIARRMNQFLFPLGGAILLHNSYSVARRQVKLESDFKKHVMKHFQEIEKHN